MAVSYFVCRLRLAFGRKTLLSRQVALFPTAYCMRANARHDWCSPPAPLVTGIGTPVGGGHLVRSCQHDTYKQEAGVRPVQ
ncbi:hypothetical protein [Prevotella denticola]